MRDRPNILLIITDQQRADHLGCAGHPVLNTPNINSIAAKGVRFDRFYVSTPVCMPNRATLMTGRLPSVHGVRHNGIPLSFNAVTFVELLRAVGYNTALIGKSHLQTQTGRPPLSRPDPAPEGYESRLKNYARQQRTSLRTAPTIKNYHSAGSPLMQRSILHFMALDMSSCARVTVIR